MRVGLTTGCFDAFHRGHRRFLQEAFHWCDYLIVAVNDDLSVRLLKGPGRPVEYLEQRLNVIRMYSDEVLSFDGDVHTALPRILIRIPPTIRICGWDQDCFDMWDVIPTAVMLPRMGDFSTTRSVAEHNERRSNACAPSSAPGERA